MRGRVIPLMRREIAEDPSSGGATWSPLALSPLIFAIADADQITESSGVISAIANQGTAGGAFEQAVVGLRVPVATDAFGAGKHGIALDANGFYELSAADPASAQCTTVIGFRDHNKAAFGVLISAGASINFETSVYSGSGLPLVVHNTGVGFAGRVGLSDVSSSVRWIRGTHDISQATNEAALYVSGSSEDNGDGGFSANNTANHGSTTWRIGARTGGALAAESVVRFKLVVPRLLTAGEVSLLDEWCAMELGL